MEQPVAGGAWRRRVVRGGIAATVLGAGVTGGAMAVGAATSSAKSTAPSSPRGHVVPARPGPREPFGVRLTITGVSSTTLEGTSRDGRTQTFALNGATRVTKDGLPDAASDLAAGERVVVVPARTSTGTPSSTSAAARSVNIVSPRLAGTVVSVTGTGSDLTIIVEDDAGFYRTIVTSSATTYRDNGKSVTSPTIATGSFLSALGSVASDHSTLDATSVLLGHPSRPTGARLDGPPPGGGYPDGPMGA